MVLINHNTDRFNIFKEVEGQPHLFLGNRNGNFLMLSDEPKSRYDGFFFFNEFRMFRIIEHIELPSAPPISEIDNNFTHAIRKRGNIKEKLFVPYFYNSFVYEVDELSKINLYLDVKEAYDNREWGRNYQISTQADGTILLKFVKSTDSREDAKENVKEYELYIAIKPDINSYEMVDAWVKREYSNDKSRNSGPFSRYVYLPFELKATRVVITAGVNKQHTLEECRHVYSNVHALERHQEQHFSSTVRHWQSIDDKHLETAYLCAQNAMHSLLVSAKDEVRILAGLPWFFQVWSRDELITAKATIVAKHFRLAKKILQSQVEHISYDGRLPNSIPENGLKSADSIGWLFKRVYNLMQALEQENMQNILSDIERAQIIEKLEHAAYLLIKYHTKDELVQNDSLETWMDTRYDEQDTARAGASLEIQALQLQIYRILHKLTRNKEYAGLERKLLNQTRKEFWSGKTLKDTTEDATARPNIFIAAYIYPNLLTRSEWVTCFKNMLPKLWLPWGGLSSIDKHNSKFIQRSTGENPKSYHHGDSWFWINNLAAIVLLRLDAEQFKGYIDKIVKASSQEILWQGALGCHAEISSASELKSEGCLNQAWSNALFVELVHELATSKKASNLKQKVLARR